ncbi:MAG: glycosyltransferase family 2 protein, partial [Desulfovibrionaceae bacterium]
MNGFRWDRVPEAVLRLLLPGAIGKTHLLQIARAAFEAGSASGDPLCMALGAEALCAAWESDVLDAAAAGQAANVLARVGGDPDLQRCAQQVRDAGGPAPPQLARLVDRGDMERVKHYVSREFDGKRISPAVLSRIAPLAAESGEAAWCLALAESLGSEAGPAGLAFCADMRFLARDLEAAAELYGQVLPDMPSPGVQSRLAGCFLRMGGTDRAAAEYRAVLAQRPWMVNARLVLHDLEAGRARERKLPPGRTAVLVYTCDKADDLARCLQALAASELGQAAMVVLDNGSRDHTPEVLAAFQDRLGADRLQTIRLPVNIGAPAARNWLAQPEALDGFAYAAFVDDDALPPPDWLQRLGAAVKHYPGAGVWGCKVTDAAEPAMVQNADLHLRPVDPEDQAASHVRMDDLHLQSFDAGLLDYMRP